MGAKTAVIEEPEPAVDPSSLPRFPWCTDCGELLQFTGSGGCCPAGCGRIYPAAGKAAWRRLARRAWVAGLPAASYVGNGLYVVVGRPELNGLKLAQLKAVDERNRLRPVKPADFERSRKGRFVVTVSKWRKVRSGKEDYKGEKRLVSVPIVLVVAEGEFNGEGQ